MSLGGQEKKDDIIRCMGNEKLKKELRANTWVGTLCVGGALKVRMKSQICSTRNKKTLHDDAIRF